MWVYLRVDEPVQYLCFTAEQANSTVQLTKTWSPTVVTLETSTDWSTWTTYTIWDTITLTNVGDKVYWRNTSETDTWFSLSSGNYYMFVMSGSIAWSGDANYLLNKNSTTTASAYCYYKLFYNCTSLTTTPSLLATTLGGYCYYQMFRWCTALTTITSLPAINLQNYCYWFMFYGCTLVKLSTTQTWEYQTGYRIPTTWTWTTATNALSNMFYGTWWTSTSVTINTTYYTSNTVV